MSELVDKMEIDFAANFGVLQEKLNYVFSNQTLLIHALTHRSALAAAERADYERLEFLGDAVLDLTIAHLLSDLHPEAREGQLSKMRAALVNTHALADVARGLEVSPFIRLGRGEFASGGAERDSILADVTEAIFGAIYLDSSFDKVFEIIKVIFQEAVRQVEPFDPKTDLQERLHVLGYPAPEYVLEAVEGPEHAPTFITMVNIKGEFAGRGQGATKKASQQQAAAVAIQKLILQEKEEKEKKVEEIVVEVAEPKE